MLTDDDIPEGVLSSGRGEPERADAIYVSSRNCWIGETPQTAYASASPLLAGMRA